MNVVVIGLGLIGGSIAYDLQNLHWVNSVSGIEINETNAKVAVKLGIVDRIFSLEEGIKNADLILAAIPVNHLVKILPDILDLIKEDTIVIDLGSTKKALVESTNNHKNVGRYVAAHPMAGTEYSGPQAAKHDLFRNSICIICNSENTDKDALMIAEKLFTDIGMHLKYMNAQQHDLHAAYVSHISHISSFVLAETVLDKEKDEQAIFDMAAGGFSSTVRLAKSSPEMWLPIFKQNAENLTEVLNTYIKNMINFRDLINDNDNDALLSKMRKSNQIKRIIK